MLQMIKCLKKSMAPVLSDISVQWLYPETKEVLLSPVGTTYLFPGDRLIAYSVVCDTTRYHSNPKSVSKNQQGSTRTKSPTQESLQGHIFISSSRIKQFIVWVMTGTNLFSGCFTMLNASINRSWRVLGSEYIPINHNKSNHFYD